MADDPAIYLTLGHGDDNIDINFESRMVLPKGFTLVTLAECGVVTTSESVYPMMDAFCDPGMKDILQNPNIHKKVISDLIGGMKLNIYNPGDLIPDLGLHLFLEWIEKTDSTNHFYVHRSGVYKFPVSNFNMPHTSVKKVEIPMNWNVFKEPVKFKNKTDILSMYEESVFPTVAEIDSMLDKTKNSFKQMKNETYFNLSDVFSRLHEGVYYFVVCRSVKEDKSNFGLLTRELMSFNKNNEETYGNYTGFLANKKPENYDKFNRIRKLYNHSTNKVKYYPTIFPYVLEAAEGIRKSHKNEYFLNPGWNSTFLNEPKSLKYKHKTVMGTRRKSLNQQSKYAIAEAVAAHALGGAGAGTGSGASVNVIDSLSFKPLNEHSSLEEVLSELPNLEMKGVDDETILHTYEEMMRRYPHYKHDITNEMYRVVLESVKRIPKGNKDILKSRIDTIRHLYSKYDTLIDAVVKKGGLMGGARKTRRNQMSGGFVPSVMGGFVANAQAVAVPLALYLGYHTLVPKKDKQSKTRRLHRTRK